MISTFPCACCGSCGDCSDDTCPDCVSCWSVSTPANMYLGCFDDPNCTPSSEILAAGTWILKRTCVCGCIWTGGIGTVSPDPCGNLGHRIFAGYLPETILGFPCDLAFYPPIGAASASPLLFIQLADGWIKYTTEAETMCDEEIVFNYHSFVGSAACAVPLSWCGSWPTTLTLTPVGATGACTPCQTIPCITSPDPCGCA